MSILSDLAKKATSALGGDVIAELLVGTLVAEAKSGGRSAVVRIATLPASTLLRLNKAADPRRIDVTRRAFAEAAADLALAIAGDKGDVDA